MANRRDILNKFCTAGTNDTVSTAAEDIPMNIEYYGTVRL